MQRRKFLKSSAILTGSMFAPFSLMANQEKIKIVILGTGWWGRDILLPSCISSGLFEIVGLCDVNTVALNLAAEAVVKAGEKKPKLFANYKEMYEMPELQAVVIATPTHWHALQFIDACKRGLHVFLEKPISYDIREGQAMLEAQRKAKNVVQVDFPRVMVDTNDKVKAIIQSGEIGKVLQVQANINWLDGAVVEKPIPKTIDYETFCGPAPKLKYLCNQDGDAPNWRAQHEFSRGVMADWGIHYIHNIRRILDLGIPNKVSAIGGIIKNFSQDNPDYLDVKFDFGGLPVYWSQKSWGLKSPMPDNDVGVFYYGEKATIFAGDLGWAIFSADGTKKVVGNIKFEPWIPDNGAKYNKMLLDLFVEFAEGIRNKSNVKITNTLEDAQKTTSCVIYGDMAYRVNAGLSINPTNMDIENNSEAKKMLKRTYRASFQHPYIL